MKNSLLHLFCTALIISLLSLGASCGSENETRRLSIGLMPAVDSAPMLLAQEKGYFADAGVEMDITIYTNAQNRQSALQSGEIDGAMTDLVALTTNVNSGFDIKGVMMTEGLFPVLTAPDFKTPASAEHHGGDPGNQTEEQESGEKPEVSVGMMEVSVSNYLSDRRLSEDYRIKKVYINEIPLRLEALLSGKLDMGIFPEPIASLGALRGLNKQMYEEESCPDIMVFTGKAMKEKGEAIGSYIQGYNRAAEDIRKNPDLAREILVEKISSLNREIQEAISLPDYPPARLQSDGYVKDIVAWTGDIIEEEIDLAPEDLLNREFVDTWSE
ncbi:MAG: ABC transporter substrate-binding protein [Spirochaetaceae bacterium]